MDNYVYHLSYILQVLVLSVFWLWRLKRRKYFVLRLVGSLIVLAGVTALISYLESLLPPDNGFVFSLPYVFIMVLFGVAYGVCFEISVDRVMLLLLLPTTAQLCGSAISTFLAHYIAVDWYVRDIIATAVMCILSFILSQIYKEVRFHDPVICRIALISSYCVVVLIFALNSFSQHIEDDFTRQIVISGYRFLMSVFIYFLVFALLTLGGVRYEKSIMEVLLQKEKKQHSLTRELTELIDIKYHDLKHLHDSGAAREFLEQDKKLIDIYGLLVDCGNDALNTILTEKNVVCKNNGIILTLLVDGSAIEFMQPTDIYVLFGNALDNAIECLLKLPEDLRHIKLCVNSVNDMVSIICENACPDKIKFEGGLPKTTKSDKVNHGFGTKSIANICKKYGAEYRMASDGETFTLSVLMPSQN